MTFRLMQPGEETTLRQFLAQDPFRNLFLISNLSEAPDPQTQVWVQEGIGLLMRRHVNWLLDPGPDPTAFDFTAAARLVDGFPPEQVRALTGRPEALQPLFARLKRHAGQLYHQRLAALTGEPIATPYTGQARPVREQDFAALCDLYADAGDLTRDATSVHRMLPTAWVLTAGDEITCAAYCSAVTDQAAMVGGVFTPPRHRHHGYGSTLVHALSAALVANGRRPCLFYHNPEAGRIYQRLGYVELGPWCMVRFNQTAAP